MYARKSKFCADNFFISRRKCQLDEDEKRILSTIKDAIKERQLSNAIALLSPRDKEIGLLMAAKTTRLETLINLIVPGANVNSEDEDRNNVLHILVQMYQNEDRERSRDDLLLECVDKLINAGADINKVNKENKTPLLTAIDKDMLEVVIHMLDGIRLRTVEPNNDMVGDARSGTLHPNTLCYLLSTYRDLYSHYFSGLRETDVLLCVGKLVDAGVDVNSANKNGEQALFIAAEAGMFQVVIFLLDKGARLVNKNGNLLHIILRLFRPDIVDKPKKDFLLPCVSRLVDAGVDLNEQAKLDPDEDKADATPMLIAGKFRLHEVGLYLADRYIEVHANDSGESQLSSLLYSVILCYSRKDCDETNDDFVPHFIDKLVRAGLDINAPIGDLNVTPLAVAVKLGMLHCVLTLIDKGAECPNYILCVLLNHYRNTGDHNSRDDLLLKCIDAIVDRNNATLHYRAIEGKETPLLIASRRLLIHVVMHLIDHGANVCCENEIDKSALQIILGAENKNIGEKLLLEGAVKLVEAGTLISTLDVDGIHSNEPIFLASSAGLFDITIYLLDRWIGVHNVHEITQDTMLNILLNSYRLKDRNKDKDGLLLGYVVLILEWYSEVNVTHRDEHVDPPLMTAARKGFLEVMAYLIDQGFDVHCLDTNKCNLLHILFKTNRNNSNDDLLLQCVRKLDEAGIDLNQMNLDGSAPVMVAAKRGLLEIVKYLIDQGAAVHYYINSQGKNLFHILKLQDCSGGCKYTQIVKTLIKIGLDVNQSDNEGNTPLYYTYRLLKDGEPDAMWELRCTLINLFINAGCNVNHQNKAGENLLMFFIKNQAPVRVIKLLIGLGTDLDVIDNKGDTACSYCVKYHINDGTKVFKNLVESGTNLISSNTGVNLLHQILMYKRYQIFLYYMGLQLIVGGTTVDGETMIHLLAKLNYSDPFNAFFWMLNGEIDINQGCLHNTTPMMIASFLLNRNYLELLTHDSQIDTNLQNDQGHTALHLCIIGFTILKEGFNKRHKGDEVIILCKQIYPIYMECIDILIGSRINVNIQDNGGKTALMLAAMKNDRVLIKKLLAAGAVVDVLDYSGRSALQYLDIYKSVFDLTCFKLLLEHGSNTILDIPCIDGNTIIQTVLCFPYFWKPRDVVILVKYLVGENCCLQRLETTTKESSFKLNDLDEFRPKERDRLRQLLYISGAPKEQVMLALDFGDDNIGDNNQDETFYSRPAQKFHTFSSNLSLKSLSRRIIRQHLGLGIKEKIKNTDIPPGLFDFLLLKDILDSKYFDVKLFDDEYDDNDFDSYDVDQDRDDDYKQYAYEYFTLSTDDELKTLYEESGQVIGQEDDDKNDADHDDSSHGDDDNDDDDADTEDDEDYVNFIEYDSEGYVDNIDGSVDDRNNDDDNSEDGNQKDICPSYVNDGTNYDFSEAGGDNDDHNREETNGSDDNRREASGFEKDQRQASFGNNRRAETDTDYDADDNPRVACVSGDDNDDDDDEDDDVSEAGGIDDVVSEACGRDDGVVKAVVSEAAGRDDDDGFKAIFSDSDNVVKAVVSDDDDDDDDDDDEAAVSDADDCLKTVVSKAGGGDDVAKAVVTDDDDNDDDEEEEED